MFVRLTGCPLRCQYCDTAYAFRAASWWDLEDILGSEVSRHGTRHVCVTGGEPLAQPLPAAARPLCDAGHDVSLETSGAIDVARSTRGSSGRGHQDAGLAGESAQSLREPGRSCAPRDQVKFVICDRADYEWSKRVIARARRSRRAARCCSRPATGSCQPRLLAEWILADRLPVRFQIQLHKFLWGEEPGH